MDRARSTQGEMHITNTTEQALILGIQHKAV
jgi:hypothetical protein